MTYKHVPFSVLNNAVQQQFNTMVASGFPIVILDIDSDLLWNTYLDAFPEGTNEVFRERRSYDCNCCKNFIRRLGSTVALTPNGYMSVWDIKVEGYYQVVVDKLKDLMMTQSIRDFYYTTEPVAGNKPTLDGINASHLWDHFYTQIPKQFVLSKTQIGPKLSDVRSTLSVFKRSLEELTLDALETVSELIAQDSLYRGAEHKKAVEDFLSLKKEYLSLDTEESRTYFIYNTVKDKGMSTRFRSTVIGTLVQDLSTEVPLEKAVKSFEDKVAPANYKRPKSLVTPAMIKKAQEKMEELGLTPALARRFATVQDIDVNHVLFTSQNEVSLNVFDDLLLDAKSQVKAETLDKVEEISLDHFIENILPKAKDIEVLFENKHTNNLMSLLTSVNKDAPKLFKWDNNFSWSYNGEVADSLRDRVASLGGRVDGALRFSHSWNHGGQNQSLMDLHVFGPSCQDRLKTLVRQNGKEIHDNYPSGCRVGWNNRKDNLTGGVQDVDHVEAPGNNIPVENIAFPDIRKMPEGVYTMKIHNWKARTPNNTGFKAEIEFGGEIFEYEYNKSIENKQWITLAEVTLKDGKFSIEHKMDTTASSKTVWGIDTQKWVKVNNILLSPNTWDTDEVIGNKHLFFIIDNCKTENAARGIYNEFLTSSLEEHRKVFELLGDKTKAQPTEHQASGLGFSSTRRDKVTVRVTGKTQRTFVINL